MIEICARAIADTKVDGGTLRDLVLSLGDASMEEGFDREMQTLARAVLTTLRDNVSEEMLEAVAPWPKHWPKEELDFPAMNAAYQTDRMVARQRFQDMLTAAMGE